MTTPKPGPSAPDLTSLSLRLALVGPVLLLALAGCGRTVSFPRESKCVFDSDCTTPGFRCVNQVCRELVLVDAGRGGKRFGEPCDAGPECNSALCAGAPGGNICSRLCDDADAGCPGSYDCKRIDGPFAINGVRTKVNACVVPQPFLCQTCTKNLDCGASGADSCLALGGGTFCGRDCTVMGCPSKYRCETFTDGGVFGVTHQCVPFGKTCDCVPANLGLEKSCRGDRNTFGACLGNQLCQGDGGFTQCNAPAAREEACNGNDDDCDGLIDNAPWPECTKTAGARICRGAQLCRASAGLQCTAQDPSPEACNYKDDDCDDVVDNGFVDARGQYTFASNCGSCGNDCSKLPKVVAAVCGAPNDGGIGCEITQCAPGYYVSPDHMRCLQLPDTLCRPCQFDADCAGPGSKCLTIDGSKVCARDCSPGSAYGACPGGYACTAQIGAASQCTPVTNTCTCRTSTLGSTRSCTLQSPANMTCNGFQTCASQPAGPSWAACDVSSFSPEICDAIDNDCDGLVDEGFRNAGTGLYDTIGHCGFCNNDCTKYFSPTLQHTTGRCDTAPATPACAMGACLTETVAGTTFEWVNVNAVPADGCECRRVAGNLTVDAPDRAPSSGAASSWVDENCDGIDGVEGDAIFVSAIAAEGGSGSRAAPLRTISQALALLQASPAKRYVLVAQGLYRENVKLFDGAQIFGGYSSDFLKRDPKIHTVTIEGQAPASASVFAALQIENAGQGVAETVVSGFTILGWAVPGGTPDGLAGATSIALFMRNAGVRVVIVSNDLIGGRGGTGGRGSTGSQGYGRQSSIALNGSAGIGSRFFSNGNCNAREQRAGGAAGLNAQCSSGDANRGGNVICPVYAFNASQGAEQEYVSPAPSTRNGRGGFDWSFSPISGQSCSQVRESGYPSNIQAHDGADGAQGPDGSGGIGGAAPNSVGRYGSVVNGVWVVSGPASAGFAGAVALGGGGGGAGGGVAKYPPGGCQGWEIGASGGGGGAGGCGGTGGQPGGGGGASIAIFVTSTTATSALPTITGNRIQRGLGGDGGNGGFGGAGGLGGAGAFGGTAARWSNSVGGKGGEGGTGGPGGGGGGGAGGPSYAVLGFNVAVGSFGATNLLLTGSSVETGGAPGSGGSSPGPLSSTGAQGLRAASADLLSLQACTAGCASGTSCDSNGVCIPN